MSEIHPGEIELSEVELTQLTQLNGRETGAEMAEHLRWCAERWLDRWERADETDRARKLSRYLVSWNELSDKDKRKDHEQIRAIPRVLEAIGRGIYE